MKQAPLILFLLFIGNMIFGELSSAVDYIHESNSSVVAESPIIE